MSRFAAANATEEDLLAATREGNTDGFLSTLLLAKVLVPGSTAEPSNWPTRSINGGEYLVTYTTRKRLEERHGVGAEATEVRFTSLISQWPGDELGFAVNPGTPVGATLSGAEIRTLAGWATEVGLIGEPDPEPEQPKATAPVRRAAPAEVPGQLLMMQKTVPAAQLPFYLDRGYDRVSGFVHRAAEVAHLTTPEQLYRALGLNHRGSPFFVDDLEVYVLRWVAHCPSLYRIPFGGQNEGGMQAMRGWVIERAPFRGNGFAPSETADVVAEFKVDSTRLPHGAQLWRVSSDAEETLIALFDADTSRWQRVETSDDA
ncbi:SseB family protein [Virgisporangium aliadipatigenens]